MQKIYDAVVQHFVGRREEAMVMLAALQSGRNVFLDGPPGTSMVSNGPYFARLAASGFVTRRRYQNGV